MSKSRGLQVALSVRWGLGNLSEFKSVPQGHLRDLNRNSKYKIKYHIYCMVKLLRIREAKCS